ncbi:MAG: ATP-binding protein [Candidatus Sedimenticola sp. (ex Thyasira tokunagai)]
MENQVADVTLHIDQEISADEMEKLLGAFKQREGVIKIQTNPEKKHLMVIKYNPEQISSKDLVTIPRYLGLRAELIGF